MDLGYSDMKNWALQGLRYDYNPSPVNYIKYRWSHFNFCKKGDPTITASLYLDNLFQEVKNETEKHRAVNKKSLTLAVIKKTLENKVLKQEMVVLFDKAEISNEDIYQFLSKIAISNFTGQDEKELSTGSATAPDLPARAYVIATHIYLEINNNELHYETLIRDTTALKEFITSKFKAHKLSGRIADMKNFSYKKILQGKNNDGAKGQLKPQLKQVAANSQVFGKNVSLFAENILKSYFEETQ